MAKRQADKKKGQHIQSAGSEALDEAQARKAGAQFEWHFGRVTRLGYSDLVGRSVTVVWDEGGVTSQQGDIPDETWEIFRLAFLTTGRIAVLSEEQGDDWMYDYGFLEAVR